MKNKKVQKILIAYYGLLQCLHLLVLGRAGFLMLGGQPAPFPILPPPGGWQEQTMPFMFALAGMDVIGIILGIRFSIQTLSKDVLHPLIGILSLTIFISGAIVFGVGTLLNSAWFAHPVSYGVMAVLFLPALVLYIKLLLMTG